MNTTLERFAPSVLSFLVLVIGGVQAAIATGPVTGVTVAQLVVLALTTFTTWLVPVIGARWRGALKTGAELAGVAITLAIPFIATGRITWAEGLLVFVAFVKAGAAELGVQIRLDPVVAPRLTGGAYDVAAPSAEPPVHQSGVDYDTELIGTAVPAPELRRDDALEKLLATARPTETTDRPGPDHRAE